MNDDIFDAPELITNDKQPFLQIKNAEQVKAYARKSLSPNTWKAYEQDIAAFLDWGGAIPASPDLVASHIVDLAGILAVSSLNRRLAAINKLHEIGNHLSPTKSEIVRMTMRGIRREHSVQQRQASPLLRDDLIAIVNALSDDVKDIRDGALLIVGFAAALRRSEIVALNKDDIEFVDEGLILNIHKSKTDQEGQGRKISIPKGRSRLCPVKMVEAWIDVLPDDHVPLFRSIRKGGNITDKRLSGGAVSTIVKDHAECIRLDPVKYSGHSLRAGFCSSAAQMGVPEWKIMKQSGHKSYQTVLRYIREAKLFEDHPLDTMF